MKRTFLCKMCEVTRSNFEEILPSIKQHIKEADFIALDTEFTGLKLSGDDRPSLFDSGEDRYKKLRKSVSRFSISQIGISIFVRDLRNDSNYTAYSYNVYLFPLSFGPIDVRFMVQASSFEFLCKHKFDFNKYVYGGVPFMNDAQGATLQQHLDKQEHLEGLDREVDERTLQEYCSRVATWLVTTEDGQKLVFDSSDEVPDMVLIGELKQRFKQIWAKEQDSQVIVEKVSTSKREKLDSDNRQHEEQRIYDKMVGFTHVFNAMVNAQKPLIGHNCLTDLMLIYEKMYKPLPAKYSTFKRELNDMFPKIFDTKHITHNLSRPLEETGLLKYTSLGDLYRSLNRFQIQDGYQAAICGRNPVDRDMSPTIEPNSSQTCEKGRFCVLNSPTIRHADVSLRYETEHNPHEAGYDAYMCGYVFLRLAHIFTAYGTRSTDLRPLSFVDYMGSMHPFVNAVNLIRGAVDNIHINDEDPSTRRPQTLFVRTRAFGQKLALDELAQLLSPYGSVDVCMINSQQALVAVANHRSSREILAAFRKNKAIKVVKYNVWRHSRIVRGVMWTGAAVFGSLSLWTLYSGFKAAQEAS